MKKLPDDIIEILNRLTRLNAPFDLVNELGAKILKYGEDTKKACKSEIEYELLNCYTICHGGKPDKDNRCDMKAKEIVFKAIDKVEV